MVRRGPRIDVARAPARVPDRPPADDPAGNRYRWRGGTRRQVGPLPHPGPHLTQVASASPTCTHSAPSASATAGLVTWPLTVFTPCANAASKETASRTPFVASSTTYGSVALVNAYVEVRG